MTMKNAVDGKTVDNHIKETIEQWGKSHRARLDDTVANYGYYYESGPTPDYTEVDHQFDKLDTQIAQLNHFVSELEYTIDRVKHALEIVK